MQEGEVTVCIPSPSTALVAVVLAHKLQSAHYYSSVHLSATHSSNIAMMETQDDDTTMKDGHPLHLQLSSRANSAPEIQPP
jgi:hypothetical protein